MESFWKALPTDTNHASYCIDMFWKKKGHEQKKQGIYSNYTFCENDACYCFENPRVLFWKSSAFHSPRNLVPNIISSNEILETTGNSYQKNFMDCRLNSWMRKLLVSWREPSCNQLNQSSYDSLRMQKLASPTSITVILLMSYDDNLWTLSSQVNEASNKESYKHPEENIRWDWQTLEMESYNAEALVKTYKT